MDAGATYLPAGGRGGAAGVGIAAAHYGSAAGELALCVRAVGIADRRDLALLCLDGTPTQLQHASRHLTGIELVAGGTAALDRSWWCRSERRLLVICAPELTGRTSCLLRAYARRSGTLRVEDRGQTAAAIGLIGSRMPQLLGALGLLAEGGTLRAMAPFSRVRVADVDAWLLLQSDRRALLIVDAAHAERVWTGAARVVRRLAGGLIGLEAARRFELLDRRLPLTTAERAAS